MKKLLFILSAIALASCGSNEEPIIPTEPSIPENPKEYIVSLGFSGEITNIGESPLSRVATDDLYGIQVYSMPTNGSEYKPYAYGLFDDKAKMTIKLLEGYKYKFAATMVVDGKNKLDTSFESYYLAPFSTTLSNKFIYSSDAGMASISRGASYTKDDYLDERPKLDRYYGESSDYSPIENGNVSIGMKRVVFGAKFVTENMPGGKITIEIKGAPYLYIEYPATEIQDIFTFSNSGPNGNKWTADNYAETITVDITWKKSDGAVIPLITQDIAFKRNKLTTITVKVKDNSINNGVDISHENTPMGDGDNIVLETGAGGNTGIIPTEEQHQ